MTNRVRTLTREPQIRTLVLIGGAVLLIVGIGLWLFLKPEGFQQKLDYTKIVSTLVGGATLVGGLLINLRNLRISQDNLSENQAATLEQLENAREQLDLTRRGQKTEHFSKAIEQLGDDKTRIRLGGIYALKQIAEQEESSDQYWQIMDNLSAYVRDRAPYDEKRAALRRDYDIQVVLNVIRDLTRRFGAYTIRDGRLEHYLDLSFSDLFTLDFSDMNLENASLVSTHLEMADFTNANLKSAYLQEAYLTRSRLDGADLTFADLRGATLEGAHFIGAKLAGADFGAARLLGANFQEAELEAEVDNELYTALISPVQLQQTNGDNTEDHATKRPQMWLAPPWWGRLPSADWGYLEPGEYSVRVGNIPMSFQVGVEEDWYSRTRILPYDFVLSHTGIGTSGPILHFAHASSVAVIDPKQPVEGVGVSKMPLDLNRWLTDEYPDSLEVSPPTEVKFPAEGVSGVQFEANVCPGKGVSSEIIHTRGIPLLPQGRDSHYWLFEGYRHLIRVLNVAGERMIIIVESPEGEFDGFVESAKEILDSVKWFTTALHEDGAAGD